jgi:hypothetical protein
MVSSNSYSSSHTTTSNSKSSFTQEFVAHNKFLSQAQLPKIVSLFSGAGGLDLGFKEQGFVIPIAIDLSPAAIETHKRNFINTCGVVADLVKLGPSGVLSHVSSVIPQGEHIGIIGGPPCQGFSQGNLNSYTNDPRNSLPALYIQIIHLNSFDLESYNELYRLVHLHENTNKEIRFFEHIA